MEEILLEIRDALRSGDELPADFLERLLRRNNKRLERGSRTYSKKRLLPFYLRVREHEPERWASWCIDGDLEQRLVKLLQVKPRRSASGVATITVVTKPGPCSGNCTYCPSDVRMPKSYLHDEPACQRAERSCFDPYLQASARLRTLREMGHATDKVELIVLGGSWTDYPMGYRVWFVEELFRALNDGDEGAGNARERREAYRSCGVSADAETLSAEVAELQRAVDGGDASYNDAVRVLYGERESWRRVGAWQAAGWEELEREQRRNESARHRVVGLVVETRPEHLDPPCLVELRRLGCTKVQMGVQSLDEGLLRGNGRDIPVDAIARAFTLLRLFGFKIHVHFMLNLLGATPHVDLSGYRQLVGDARFLPDEVKLYPCVLVAGTGLAHSYERGEWEPYDEETLVSLLVRDVASTPCYTRVSRMVRDISAADIVAGCKKTNLRQAVEGRLAREGAEVHEIRYREIGVDAVDVADLSLEETSYATSAGQEVFLQWVDPEGRIAGFLRLALPDQGIVRRMQGRGLPIGPGEAMIREVHVYGHAASLHSTDGGAQHLGLGRRLVERACDIVASAGYNSVNVISAVGTREYYRRLGFADAGLYQNRPCPGRGPSADAS